MNNLSRRSFLRGLAGSAIALPALEATAPRIAHAATDPLRFLLFMTPNGIDTPGYFEPNVNADGSLNLQSSGAQVESVFTALSGHEQDIAILGGITCPGAHDQNHGTIGPATLHGMDTNAGIYAGPSIDQQLADRHGGDTKYSVLRFGVQTSQPNTCTGPGSPVSPQNDPYAVFQELVADLDTDPAEIQWQHTRRKSVLDGVRGDLQRIRPSLSSSDRIRVDQHLSSLREVEKRVLQTVSCAPIDLGEAIDIWDDHDFAKVARLQMDLMVMALTCDATRITTLQFHDPGWWAPAPWHPGLQALGREYDIMHEVAHAQGHAPMLMQRWFAEQYAYLLDQLALVPNDSGGTLLDDSLLMWTTELGDGGAHSVFDLSFVLGGGAGGQLRRNQFLGFGGGTWGVSQCGQCRTTNDLMLTVSQMFDPSVSSFGETGYNNGPIGELVA